MCLYVLCTSCPQLECFGNGSMNELIGKPGLLSAWLGMGILNISRTLDQKILKAISRSHMVEF